MSFSFYYVYFLPLHHSHQRGGSEELHLDLLCSSVSPGCEHGIPPSSEPGRRQGDWYIPAKNHPRNTCNNLVTHYDIPIVFHFGSLSLPEFVGKITDVFNNISEFLCNRRFFKCSEKLLQLQKKVPVSTNYPKYSMNKCRIIIEFCLDFICEASEIPE